MKIAVVGAKRGQCGSTTLSLLIALWLSNKYNKKVSYLASDDDYKSSLAILSENTIFQDIKNIYSLLKSDRLNIDAINQFSDSNIKNLDIFPHMSIELTSQENEEIQRYMLNKLPYDYKIIDLREDDSSLQTSLNNVDLLIMVATQDKIVLNSAEFFGNSIDKSKMLLVNKFDNEICSKLSIRGSFFSNKEKWIKRAKFVNYDPSITKYKNASELYDLVNIIKEEKQPIFIHLSKVLDDIVKTIFIQNGDSLFLGGEEDE